MDSYSLSDIRAAVDGGDGMGFGGGSWVVWILLFALLGGGGFGFGGGNRAASVDEVASGFNFAGINNKLNELVAGQANLNQNLGNSICQLGYKSLEQTGALSAQMASCCCDLKTAIHAEAEATRNMIQQDKIEALQSQISALQLNQALCGVIRYPTATTYAVPSTCFGFNNCGCNNCTY